MKGWFEGAGLAGVYSCTLRRAKHSKAVIEVSRLCLLKADFVPGTSGAIHMRFG